MGPWQKNMSEENDKYIYSLTNYLLECASGYSLSFTRLLHYRCRHVCVIPEVIFFVIPLSRQEP